MNNMKVLSKSLIDFFHRHRRTLLLIATVTLITILLQTLVSIWLSKSGNFYIPSLGTIHALNVEVYGGDIRYLNGQPTLDWGVVYPGSQINRSFFIKTKSNINGTLKIKAGNWTFKNSETFIYNSTEWMAIERIYNGTKKLYMEVLKGENTIMATITLKVSNSDDFINWIIEKDIKTFSFDIYVILEPKPK